MTDPLTHLRRQLAAIGAALDAELAALREVTAQNAQRIAAMQPREGHDAEKK